MSEDEYDAYNDFAELTEEDLARLDASYSSAPPIVDANSSFVSGTAQSQAAAGPSISIEIEATPMENQTPIHKYRWRGTLSVTDIVSLAWCEVQFDYGLQQKRSRRLADRPASFTLDSGKQIVVQQDVAARNDKTTKRGRFIHKELELELQHEEIKIGISSEEERWALRLLNFLSSLVSLITEGCVREVPVVGIVNGVAVVGIIVGQVGSSLLVINPIKQGRASPQGSPFFRGRASPNDDRPHPTFRAYYPGHRHQDAPEQLPAFRRGHRARPAAGDAIPPPSSRSPGRKPSVRISRAMGLSVLEPLRTVLGGILPPNRKNTGKRPPPQVPRRHRPPRANSSGRAEPSCP